MPFIPTFIKRLLFPIWKVLETSITLAAGVLAAISGACVDVTSYWLRILLKLTFWPYKEKKYWQGKLKGARTYEEWRVAARQLDRIEGRNKWKVQMRSNLYDYDLVQGRIQQLRDAQDMGDEGALKFLLRTSLSRDFGGINNSELFKQCREGTKLLIEEFNEEIINSLQYLSKNIDSISNPIELKQKMELFKELRHSLGNTALLLSGGASLGMYHIGILKALYENGILPRIIAGASSGSIMAAIACCRNDEDFPKLLRIEGINTHLLEEAVPPEYQDSWLYPLQKKIFRFFRHGVVFDGEVLKNSMRESLGDVTFLEAYRNTNRVLNIAVSSTTLYDMPSLLNYITSPNVLIWSAVAASCAVPALYQAAPLLAKDHRGEIVPWNVTGDRWCDGSMENDLPMKRLSEIFNVNHFIVSQVNPHIYPFVRYSVNENSWTQKFLYLIKSEIIYRFDQLERLGLLPRSFQMIRSVFIQKYHGDITIIPELSWNDILHMFVDRPISVIKEAECRGEIATWPKISAIKSQLSAELTLDEILLKIRDRLQPLITESKEESISDCSKLLESMEYSDVMFDPIVNIHRHLSPNVLLRNHMTTHPKLRRVSSTSELLTNEQGKEGEGEHAHMRRSTCN